MGLTTINDKFINTYNTNTNTNNNINNNVEKDIAS